MKTKVEQQKNRGTLRYLGTYNGCSLIEQNTSDALIKTEHYLMLEPWQSNQGLGKQLRWGDQGRTVGTCSYLPVVCTGDSMLLVIRISIALLSIT